MTGENRSVAEPRTGRVTSQPSRRPLCTLEPCSPAAWLIGSTENGPCSHAGHGHLAWKRKTTVSSAARPWNGRGRSHPGCLSGLKAFSPPHFSPPHEATEDPTAQEDPCSQLLAAPSQPSPPESPRPEPNLGVTWTSQALDSVSDPGSSENPGASPSEGLLAVHLQPLEEPEAPRSPAAPASNWQEPQARSGPRVAELKKCFEG